MNLVKAILTGSILALCATAAHADLTVYITGATAFRSPAITEIENFLDTSRAGVYGSKSGVTSELDASNVAIRGTTSKISGLGLITFKCAWGGSVGGVKLIQSVSTFSVEDQPGVNGWIPDGDIPTPAAGTITAIAASAEDNTVSPPTIGGFAFQRRATGAPKPHAAFTDAFQSSALGGASGDAIPMTVGTNPNGIVGVIPFDWVVCNGVTSSSVRKITGYYASGANVINYTAVADITGAAATISDNATIGGVGIPKGTTILSHTGTTSGTITLPVGVTTTAANGTSAAPVAFSAADTAAAPASLTNISSNQADATLIQNNTLALFSGVAADSVIGVYQYGRNADSGTRISLLGESYRGITQTPSFFLQPTISGQTGPGKGGAPFKQVTAMGGWPNETILGTFYDDGQSGYTSGGDLADALATPGAPTADFSAIGTPAGWMIGYLGRSDSSRACRTNAGQNTARRLTFNGQQDWTAPATPVGLSNFDNKQDGTPQLGFNDTAVKEGAYQGWEYEHFYRRGDLVLTSPDPVLVNTTKVLNSLATAINALAAAPSGSILYGQMHATRVNEGAPIFR